VFRSDREVLRRLNTMVIDRRWAGCSEGIPGGNKTMNSVGEAVGWSFRASDPVIDFGATDDVWLGDALDLLF
jgi:hypothetical protein